jgi:hypothetical protein
MLKGSMPLVEIGRPYGENELGIRSAVLNSTHPEHLWFFLNGGLLGTICP